jgi:hypothetical protein
MWIHKMCTDLTQEQFIKQSDDRNMEYTCTLCRTMDDDLIQCELEQDRIGHLIKALGFLSSFSVDFSSLFISFLSQ